MNVLVQQFVAIIQHFDDASVKLGIIVVWETYMMEKDADHKQCTMIQGLFSE